jgi:hypothetical protein
MKIEIKNIVQAFQIWGARYYKLENKKYLKINLVDKEATYISELTFQEALQCHKIRIK